MEPYKPVACDFVDQIEIAALRKKSGLIRFLADGEVMEVQDQVINWETANKVEYLITLKGSKIRLDQILWLFDQEGPAVKNQGC